jgi:hypothetical protein
VAACTVGGRIWIWTESLQWPDSREAGVAGGNNDAMLASGGWATWSQSWWAAHSYDAAVGIDERCSGLGDNERAVWR